MLPDGECLCSLEQHSKARSYEILKITIKVFFFIETAIKYLSIWN